ncbi:single-stranded DNA-binding protein [Corynebacterium sp. MC-04]|uniref:Single-stranded DNA-binding protein n=1 Tax=Corynebacterium parakroppenstedtii TaxID=2828363 RepID=A0ABS9HJT0_9CORY|nr:MULTISPECIES: single-stranded DNA-binding protein [Corynebacterium]MDU3197336.1 single-stranded DNA-binding protein [Corynebacterium kroppenstedtii]MBY0788105.1 single-stranded DNA-binding protein [Corynebacterium parakroppenstedtii]MBY0792181.1 single-stranded DNA-binding protein [Corynebacterium parakroppenstedtii]MBY0796063.1 single-stranded DNA-binding protein [Corynebacterium parakroppenstedtii]MCF6769130.1 single-stranded DNA-binding protein [Corynebacterium parakroppenstedtii]
MAQNSAMVTVVGNVVSDPVDRTPSGRTPFATMRVASDRRWRDDDGVWQSSDSLFIDVQMSGSLATHCLKSVTKGMPVVIYGRLITHSWEATLDSGEKITRSSVRIKASHVGVDLNKIVITSAMASRLGRLVPLEIGSASGAAKGSGEATSISTDWDGTVVADENPFPEGSSANSSTSSDSTSLRDSATLTEQREPYSQEAALASA